MTSIARFLRLPSVERRLVFDTALVVAMVRLGLWLLPLRSVRRMTARIAGKDANGSKPAASRISWAVDACSRRIPGGGNCLVKAVAAEAMLARFGYASQLKIGVARNPEGRFEAHAWIVSEGGIVTGRFDPGRYVELAGPGAGRL